MTERDLISAGDVFDFIEKKNLSEKFDKNNPLYWKMLSEVIIETQLIRTSKGITQNELAELMDTKQTSISRFENMGRAPNYDFIVRLAHALDCNPKLFIDGKYVIQVPVFLKEKIEYITDKKSVAVGDYLINSISQSIERDYKDLNAKRIQNDPIIDGDFSLAA